MKPKKEKLQLSVAQTKYISYARLLCLIFQVLFIGYLIFVMSTNSLSYQQLIQKNPILLAGFIVCLLNLFIWYQSKQMITDLMAQKFYSYYRVIGCLFIFIQFLLFNYPSAILFAIGLKKCFYWGNSPFHNIITRIGEEGKKSKLLMNIIVLGLGTILTLWFIAAFS